jgi:hypothetical protein
MSYVKFYTEFSRTAYNKLRRRFREISGSKKAQISTSYKGSEGYLIYFTREWFFTFARYVAETISIFLHRLHECLFIDWIFQLITTSYRLLNITSFNYAKLLYFQLLHLRSYHLDSVVTVILMAARGPRSTLSTEETSVSIQVHL